MTPQKLDQMVTARVATVQRAQKIIGDALVTEGKTDADMRKQVVLAKLGETAKDWTERHDHGLVQHADGRRHAATATACSMSSASSPTTTFGSDPRGKAYDEYNNDISNRWKTAGGRVAQ